MAEEKEIKEEKIELSKDAEKVLELIEGMNVLELNALVKVMEEKFGVAPLAAVAPQVAATPSETEEEKSTYDVVLENAGEQKIAAIKAVRAINPDLGLKEARSIVEGAPKAVVENLPAEEAEKAKKVLEEAGATVTLK